jgi:hypothetical protein
MFNLLNQAKTLLIAESKVINFNLGALFHTTSCLDKVYNTMNRRKPRRYLEQNKVIFEPQKPDEPRRPAVI